MCVVSKFIDMMTSNLISKVKTVSIIDEWSQNWMLMLRISKLLYILICRRYYKKKLCITLLIRFNYVSQSIEMAFIRLSAGKLVEGIAFCCFCSC